MNFIIFLCVALKLFSLSFVPLLALNPGNATDEHEHNGCLGAQAAVSRMHTNEGPKVKDLNCQVRPPCPKQTAFHSHDQPPTFGQWGPPMPGPAPGWEGGTECIMNSVNI